MSRTEQKKKIFDRGLLPGTLVSLAFGFLIFLYAPIDMYCANNSEFLFEIWELLPLILLLFFLTFLGMQIVYLILYRVNRKLYHAGLAAGMILFLATYIQGNFLVSDLPPLDGTTVDWAEYDMWRLPSILVWVIVAVVVIAACIIGKEFIYQKAIPFLTGCMTLMLLVTAVTEMISSNVFARRVEFIPTEQDEFTMSENQNFVILLLDALDARVFSEMLPTHPEYSEMFADFTYYENTMSSYPYTQHSIPYILSGDWYENDEPFDNYMVKVYHAPLFDELRDHGYQLDFYESELMVDGRDMEEMPFGNIVKEHFETDAGLQLAIQEVKLIGFRYAPYDLKKKFFPKKSGFDELSTPVTDLGADVFDGYNDDFYTDIRNTDIEVTDAEGYFKFIHLEGAHVPFTYDKNVNTISVFDGSYEQNIEASMTLTKAYLDKLKAAGVYDNTVLIILADHGYEDGNGSWGRECPILLIKGKNETHDTIQISEAPIAHGDLQEAYVRLMDGAASDEVFDWKDGDVRERRFLYYVYLHDNHMEEYIQTDKASNLDTLLPTGRTYDK